MLKSGKVKWASLGTSGGRSPGTFGGQAQHNVVEKPWFRAEGAGLWPSTAVTSWVTYPQWALVFWSGEQKN